MAEEIETQIQTPFNLWISDWISNHPPADSIVVCNNVIATSEIMNACYIETMDETITQEMITAALIQHEYVYESGGWLTK